MTCDEQSLKQAVLLGQAMALIERSAKAEFYRCEWGTIHQLGSSGLHDRQVEFCDKHIAGWRDRITRPKPSCYAGSCGGRCVEDDR